MYNTKKEMENYITFMDDSGNHSHIMTLTFTKYFSVKDKEEEKYRINKNKTEYINKQDINRILKRFLKELNRKFYGANNRCGEKLNGFIVKEYKLREIPHFHILLKEDNKFYEKGKPTIEQHIERLIEKFTYNVVYNRQFKFNRENCDLTKTTTDIFNYSYFLKEYGDHENFDFIRFL